MYTLISNSFEDVDQAATYVSSIQDLTEYVFNVFEFDYSSVLLILVNLCSCLIFHIESLIFFSRVITMSIISFSTKWFASIQHDATCFRIWQTPDNTEYFCIIFQGVHE